MAMWWKIWPPAARHFMQGLAEWPSPLLAQARVPLRLSA
jgi:hypothetical protein